MDYKQLYKKYKIKYKLLQLSGSYPTTLQRSRSDSNINLPNKPYFKRSKSTPFSFKHFYYPSKKDDFLDDDLYDEAKDTDWEMDIDDNMGVDPYVITRHKEIPSSLDEKGYVDIDPNTNTFHPIYGSQKIKRRLDIEREREF